MSTLPDGLALPPMLAVTQPEPLWLVTVKVVFISGPIRRRNHRPFRGASRGAVDDLALDRASWAHPGRVAALPGGVHGSRGDFERVRRGVGVDLVGHRGRQVAQLVLRDARRDTPTREDDAQEWPEAVVCERPTRVGCRRELADGRLEDPPKELVGLTGRASGYGNRSASWRGPTLFDMR